MKKKTDFSEYGNKNKLRIMDFAGKTPLYYDKKMTTVLLGMEYSEAFAKNSVDPELKQKMLALIDETWKGFIKKVDISRPEYQTILENIKKINEPDYAGNLIEANEFISIQLTAFSNVSGKFIRDIDDIKKVCVIPINKPDALLEARTLIRITDKEVTKPVIPVYSSSATIGFNTILFSIFHNFLPVGVGEAPHVVHDNMFGKNPIRLLLHDYAHSTEMERSIKDDPKSFELHKKIYFELFENKKNNKIDDKTFKTHLLVLFFLVYDSANAQPYANFESVKNFITKTFFVLINDFKTPLEDLGYVIDKENPEKSLRTVLLGVVEEFLMLHPELKTSPLFKPVEIVVPEVPVIPTVPENKPVEPVAPPDPELERIAKKNEYIIKPATDFFDRTAEHISFLLDINNSNYRNFMDMMVKSNFAQTTIEEKVRSNTILDSTSVAAAISDLLMDFKKAPTLRRLLKSANPPFDFDKEYAEAMKSVDARHQEVSNRSENTVSVTSHSIFKQQIEKPPIEEPILEKKEVNVPK